MCFLRLDGYFGESRGWKLTTCDGATQYLAAIFDGEGTVAGHTKGRPEISISNTEQSIINAICECLEILKISYTTSYRKMKNPLHSPLTTVRVSRRDEIDRFIELVPVRSDVKKARLAAASVRPRCAVRDKPISAIKKLRKEKKSWRTIGEELGYSAFAVHQWAKQAGIPTKAGA